MQPLEQKLEEILRRADPPGVDSLHETLHGALDCLCREPDHLRPRDFAGRPGGVIQLDTALPTILVPDLHGRMGLLRSVLAFEPRRGARAVDLLADGRLQVVCLGDGVHTEGKAAQRRWRAALKELEEGFRLHENMDAEMRDSLGAMQMVMEIKRSFPEHFHFLKGNHENIANELGGGNFPFRKFALEGLMVLQYMVHFYGLELLSEYARFEKELPLLAVGRAFLASHAEPAAFYPRERVIDYRDDAEVVAGLTWTDNDQAEAGSVQRMLEHYLGEEADHAYYFGGHRWTPGGYSLRAGGRYVQIHDPGRFVIACLPHRGDIKLDRDILEIAAGPLR